MDLPALLPKELEFVAKVENDRGLYSLLVKNPQELTSFFEAAADDETWSGEHASFMKEAIQWMTNQFFQDRLSVDLAAGAAAKIREHIHILEPMIANNLKIILNGKEIPYEASGLLWGSSSEYLRNMIRQECRDKNKRELRFEGVSQEVFDQIVEYVNTGTVADLWRKDKGEVTEVLAQAAEWGLKGLAELSQDILRRYITRGNVIEMLLQAHEEKWSLLRDSCIDFVNALDIGAKFDKGDPDSLFFEFVDFSPDALEIFEAIRFNITHLICGKDLTDKPPFSDVINRCPNMVCLDISGTNEFTDRLLDIPNTLEELDVSKCEWLNQKTLKMLVQICPNLVKIRLASNSHIKYSTWGILKDFKRLEKLDISRCTQIKDEDFKIILQAARGASHFYLDECTGLTDNAFFDLGKNIPKLTDLDVSRTNITNSGLIDLTMRCKQLITLKASRCPNLSDKGVLEAVENAPKLKMLEIIKLKEGQSVQKALKEARPYLEVVF